MNEAFITEIKFRLNESLPRIDKCLNLLTEEASLAQTQRTD